MDKAQLRKIYKEKRKKVSDRETKELAVLNNLITVLPSNSKNMFIYESIGGEVSTVDIIKYFREKLTIYVPEVDGQNMKLFNRENGEYLNISCDVTIVPLIAFDNTLNRIGFGGGYYDRYLSKNPTLAIGIAFDEQECECFEKESTDVALDMIVTPTRILRSV